MAHPKSRISKQRKRKRRTHKKAVAPQYSICPNTGEAHLRHHAYEAEDGALYYRGKVLIPGPVVEEETIDEDDE